MNTTPEHICNRRPLSTGKCDFALQLHLRLHFPKMPWFDESSPKALPKAKILPRTTSLIYTSKNCIFRISPSGSTGMGMIFTLVLAPKQTKNSEELSFSFRVASIVLQQLKRPKSSSFTLWFSPSFHIKSKAHGKNSCPYLCNASVQICMCKYLC